ncbi:NAD-dependent epimerase/dehydratase family protein, partial [Halorubrum sp. SP9]
VCLRYFNVFGPWQDPNGEYAAVIPKFISIMMEGKRPTIFGDGEQSRDFTFIDNVIAANVGAAESDASGVVCNVGCGNRVTVNELVERINEHLGTDISPIYDSPRPGDVRHSLADLEWGSQTIDYEPIVHFDEGLRRTIEHFEEQNF